MNNTIETILAHRSIRKFTAVPITDEQRQTIIQAGLAASSSSMLQVVSIVRVTDSEKRKQLAQFAGNQAYVESAAEFLVFCIDYQRHTTINPDVQADFTELTLIGAVDSGIMAQNCLLAAESMGLGGVYIGGLRNSAAQVDKLLGLPENSAVLFGMCLGHPDQNPEVKPRLPAHVVVHENQYQELNLDDIQSYDQTMQAYYASRTSNQKLSTWSQEVTGKLAGESRPHILPYLNSKGLAKR
ncbi:TPA: oxygen-insensitive NADPH nitroreductase [Vibrio harveyi]|uniref:oxygen-insensitive NADPH nitroreductase n=1 Tax=Vibrio harveyi TaxID=669 RepID=UPI0005EDE7FE|nr:oxygen-insensitive NADPH nitroreductase [Vibrio harveyi]KNY44457.1 NADPH-flavin oxidoreductase [Vibrio harveyi]HDM8051998.1 oxygen-insensitive NADPH nitroreductase [Vibrio harveyi]HDM8192173.1 oxygen-insensitive NADPH nitroreductase [Vibrio harveyi]HDM8201435.1 oxygen-insensitive NADPH nitroreductase [Vibrio harveyi]